MQGLNISSRSHVRALLRELCADRAPAWVHCPDADGSIAKIAVRFAGLESSGLRMLYRPGPVSAWLNELGQGQGQVRVEFGYRGRARKFTTVKQLASESGSGGAVAWAADESAIPGLVAPARLHLRLPESVEVVHTRRAFRIPVVDVSALRLSWATPSARLRSDPRLRGINVHDAKIIDISAVGMGVATSSLAHVGDLPLTGPGGICHVGDEMFVHLQYGSESVELAAHCVRVTANVLGFSFPQSMRGDEIVAPFRLTKILRELERLWLRRRAEARDRAIETGVPALELAEPHVW